MPGEFRRKPELRDLESRKIEFFALFGVKDT